MSVAVACGALLLAAAPVGAYAASPGDDGVIIWNEDYELPAGEVREGDLIVFNGDVRLGPGSRVEGTVVVWGGDVTAEGTIEGDLVASGGALMLGSQAVVRGNVVCSWSCDLTREEGARIEGEMVEGFNVEAFDVEWLRELNIRLPAIGRFDVSGPSWVVSYVFGALRTVFGIAVVAALAALVRAMWPEQTSQVAAVIVGEPLACAGFGLLTAVVAAVVLAVVALTICLLPLAALGGLAVIAAGLFGWACVGAVVGERLLQALSVREVAPPWAAALGALLVSALTGGLSAAPFIGICLGPLGGLVAMVVGCLGLGAVVLTRFGTASYPAPAEAVAVPLPQPPAKPKRPRKKAEEK